jgi:hypothetical protein
MMDIKLTTVKVVSTVYDKFKEKCFDTPMTFQKIVNRSLIFYLSDNDYKEKIDKFNPYQLSGSLF